MKTLIAITAVTVLVALYVTILRPWMRTTTWGEAFLAKIEPIEYTLYRKSESIFWARFKVLLGTVLTLIMTTDLTPVMGIIPEKYRVVAAAAPTIALMLDGVIGEWLRRDTTKPLDVVSLRTDAPEEAKAAAADADAVSKEAVEVIREAKAN